MAFLGKVYFRIMPDFILESRFFHLVMFKCLIGKWFDVDFRDKYENFDQGDWERIYDELFVNRIREDDLTDSQKKRISQNISGATVLDVGCGSGTLVEFLSNDKTGLKKIVGTDISGEAIEHAKRNFGNDRVDFEKISIEEMTDDYKSRFDTVICTHVLEHIIDVDAAIKSLLNIANERLIVIVPDEVEHKYTPAYHVHFFNKDNPLSKLLDQYEYSENIVDGDFLYVINKK